MFRKTIPFRIFMAVSFLCIGCFVFLPILWMINTALKPATETFTLSFFKSFTLANFRNVISDERIMRYMGNSLFVSLFSSVLSTAVAALAGYSFSKFRYRGRKSIMALIMMAQAFPYAILLLTIYVVMRAVGLLDSYISLILSYITFTLPIGSWTLKNYFDQIPTALLESARIDGAGHLKTLLTIVLPVAIPGIVSVAIYGFVWSWNDLLYSLTLITATTKRTLAPGLIMTYMGEFTSNWSNMMAASIAVSVPVTIMFIFLQRFFIQGMTAGSVKG